MIGKISSSVIGLAKAVAITPIFVNAFVVSDCNLCAFPVVSQSPHKKELRLMWLFTSKSFLSVVADKENPTGDRLLVRSRIAGDIEEVFPDANIMETCNADYRFRAWVSREKVNKAISEYVQNLNYINFKNSVEDQDRIRPLMGVWNTMYEYQEAQLNARSRDFI